jgi:hypothetical protein
MKNLKAPPKQRPRENWVYSLPYLAIRGPFDHHVLYGLITKFLYVFLDFVKASSVEDLSY